MKLNIGSGGDLKEGYLNIDINPDCNPDICLSILKMDFPEASISDIYAKDIIEHIEWAKVDGLFHKFAIWLMHGGCLYLELPNMAQLAVDIIANNHVEDAMKRIYGGQTHYGNYHKCGFTPNTIKVQLEKYTFNHIEIIAPQDSWNMKVSANCFHEEDKNEKAT